MTTEARILANRLNAQKSTGPNTPQGKAVVSQNALKHGLSARHDVIITESQADFDLHRDALLAELHPQGPMESILADRIVSLSWRLKRADLIQNQAIDALHEESTAKLFPALTRLLTPENQDPDLILGRIALKDFSNERVLDRLLMYERRIEHSLFKTMLEFQRLRLLRNLESSQPNLQPYHPHSAPAPVPSATTDENRTPEPPTISNQSADPLAAEPSRSARSAPASVPEGHLHYAKRTQFENSPDDPNTIQNKHLQQHQPSPPAKKRTQTNPIHPPQYAIQTSIPPRDCPLQTRKETLQSTSHSCEMENPPLAEQESKILENSVNPCQKEPVSLSN